jgi:hypothetical protein
MSEGQDSDDRMPGNPGQELARKNLIQVAVDDVNWKVLYRNAVTGDYWKEFFPDSGMHGGGPPAFVKISKEEARREFKIGAA